MARIVQIKNVNQPGKTYPRDADKFEKICAGLLSVLPKDKPGLNQSEIDGFLGQMQGVEIVDVETVLR